MRFSLCLILLASTFALTVTCTDATGVGSPSDSKKMEVKKAITRLRKMHKADTEDRMIVPLPNLPATAQDSVSSQLKPLTLKTEGSPKDTKEGEAIKLSDKERMEDQHSPKKRDLSASVAVPGGQEWTTVSRGKKQNRKKKGGAGGPIKQSESAKNTLGRSSSAAQPSNGSALNRKKAGAPDTGDGSMVYAQLVRYLINRAPHAYVLHTVKRLTTLAKERRFNAYLTTIKKNKTTTEERSLLRSSWMDEASVELREKYKGVVSHWDCDNEQHAERLAELMATWVLKEKMTQAELETRLRFFTLESANTVEKALQKPSNQTVAAQLSFKDVVTTPKTMPPKFGLQNEDQSYWYKLCMKPASKVTKLRARTAEEETAVEMILNYKLEVPVPPRFLVQSMDTRELAIFTDIFMALEYPLYAHLVPGQRFGPNMSKFAILQNIHMGAEAAPMQKQEIAEFKSAISRAEIDANARVVKVTFKGKQSAQRWVGWKMPLNMKLLELIDYEKQRQDAKVTNEVVKLDIYSLSLIVIKGKMTSLDMYWLLTNKLGLRVQAMEHPEIEGISVNDKQWIVDIEAESCPEQLRQTSHLKIGSISLLLFHHTVYQGWPCAKCYQLDHAAKYCIKEESSANSSKMSHTLVLDGKLPSETGRGGRDYQPEEIPKTMAALMDQIKGTIGRAQMRREEREKQQYERQMKNRPYLPAEWEQTSNVPAPEQQERESEDMEIDSYGVSREQYKRDVQAEDNVSPPADTERYTENQPSQESQRTIGHENIKVRTSLPETLCGAEKQAEEEGQAALRSSPLFTVQTELGEIKHQGQISRGQYLSLNAKVPKPGIQPAPGHTTSPKRKASDEWRTNPTVDVDVFTQSKLPLKSAKGAKTIGNTSSTGQERGRTTQINELKPAIVRHRPPNGTQPATRGPADAKRPVSPKRKVPEEWLEGVLGHNVVVNEGNTLPHAQVEQRQRLTRSLSPIKTRRPRNKTKGGAARQQFIHQFLHPGVSNAPGVGDPNANEATNMAGCVIVTRGSEEKKWRATVTDDFAGATDMDVSTSDNEECKITDIRPGTDLGAPLEFSLRMLDGTLVDVAAKGQCGWLAGYAALHNHSGGLLEPSPDVVEAVNLMKKDILNGMIVSLTDEYAEHPQDVDVELEESGIRALSQAPHIVKVCALANHYVAQRDKSVRTAVPIHYWVRPAHLKGMAVHARETIYVLDVDNADIGRLQAYAYRCIKLDEDDSFDSGTVQPIPTEQAISLLTDLLEAGILTPVMVLRWKHFQAVTYNPDKYATYISRIEVMAKRRNEILVYHGWQSLDYIQFDSDRTAQAAALELRELRKARNEWDGVVQIDSHGVDDVEGKERQSGLMSCLTSECSGNHPPMDEETNSNRQVDGNRATTLEIEDIRCSYEAEAEAFVTNTKLQQGTSVVRPELAAEGEDLAEPISRLESMQTYAGNEELEVSNIHHDERN